MDVPGMYFLTGKRALVCGSTQGIGRACAFLFAQLGASVILLARNEAALTRVREELASSHGQRHDFIVADCNEPAQVRDRVLARLPALEPVHILLNNSGGPPAGELLASRAEDFTVAFARHVLCNHLLAQTLIGGMKSAGYGRIINIVSTSVKEPIPGLGVSNTIRAAVANWAKTLAREVAPFGITVNNVLPGSTKTARIEEIIRARATASGRTEQSIREEMISQIPMGRMAEPEEIAAAAGFLASPAAGYITGINLPVDGGRTGCL
ncbi:MAG: SDR family oxidoreductase [Phycisphaerae bacterium]|nr:SDR family oxidoreductase [Phycisphaerae bacterium]MDW8263023.1 SDR family oxidoreductase [Phycisphaerales bacterium]